MFLTFKRSFSGPLLVSIAAFLWATDSLVRYPTAGLTDPIFIVFFEHILAVLILLPWVFFQHKKEILALSSKEWASAIFSGIGGSALATFMFTASFAYVNPSVSILLQKLQPILVVLIAYLFLGERPQKKFYFWGSLAFIAGVILSFPDFNFHFLFIKSNLHTQGIYYAFGAASIWAISTITGKVLLQKTPPAVATFWRFFFGLIGCICLYAFSHNVPSLSEASRPDTLLSLLYLTFIPGLLAMLLYYRGLAHTPASITTFIELVYPIGAVILNTLFLQIPLGTVEAAAGTGLVFSVFMILKNEG